MQDTSILKSCGNYPVRIESSTDPQCDFNGWKNSLIALRDISPGEIIYREKSFLISADNDFNHHDMLKTGIEEKLSKCSVTEMSKYRELRCLSSLKLHRGNLDVGIALTHAVKLNKVCDIDWSCSLDSSCIHMIPLRIDVKTNDRAKTAFNFVGIFLSLGFMPHSCSPNTVIDIDSEGVITIRASKYIRTGESATRSWIPDLYLSRIRRSHDFILLFGDRMCRCEVCSRETTNLPHSIFDDTLRLRIRERVQQFARLVGASEKPPSSTTVLKVATSLIRLLEHAYYGSFCSALMISRLHLRVSALQMVSKEKLSFLLKWIAISSAYM
jgi:hypothetical protein